MTENIFEIRFVDHRNMPEEARREIVRQVSKKPEEFRKKWKGYAKVVYVTASPPKIKTIEPVEGESPAECFRTYEKEIGVEGNVF